VEYVGFSSVGTSRVYTLRIRQVDGTCQDFTVSIPINAFLTHHLRFQDGPEICFLKLQRALKEAGGALPETRQAVTEQELADYKVAHQPKPPTRRAPPVPVPAS
jgi:hypothetical protein